MTRSFLVALLVLAACASVAARRSLADERDAEVVAMRRVIQQTHPKCDFAAATVTTRNPDHAMHWLVEGCGGALACREFESYGVACYEEPPRLGDYGTERLQAPPRGFATAAASASQLTGCPALDARVRKASDIELSLMEVHLCDRDFICEPELDRRDRLTGARCRETSSSTDRTERRIVVDRLALETACPPTRIAIASTAAWQRGTERAYRLTACGRSFVCTTAAGRTDCKPAMEVPDNTGADAGWSQELAPSDAGPL